MSFRTRLTSFFVVIVILPMLGVGFLVFKLIGQSEQGKADARANGLATAGASLYQSQRSTATRDAKTIARAIGALGRVSLERRVSQLASQAGLARVTVTQGQRRIVDVGDHRAIAPGIATITGRPRGSAMTVTASELTAPQYARDLLAPGVGIVVSDGTRTLAATPPAVGHAALPQRGTVRTGGREYRVVTQPFRGFGAAPVRVTVLSNLSSTGSSVSASRVLAAAFIAAFVLLAFSFSVLASRALQRQLSQFLEAAKRLADGDFSSRVPTDGRDEFAALGNEFNRMSAQLAHRIDELAQERARLREAIRRIGETFASNLDRPGLLKLALKTAVDAVHADFGQLRVREEPGRPLTVADRLGDVTEGGAEVLQAERSALNGTELGEAGANGFTVASVALGHFDDGTQTHGLITVGRTGRPFTDDERDVLRSLASQTALALENVQLHHQVSRQAVTDELTGLANHGRFQELLSQEIDQVRRYHHKLGLIMLDIDDFKSINDTYGHQQGDVVLKHVGGVLRASSREVDVPARYGGEEMALILPHTDLEGSYAIAERVRSSIEGLPVPRLDGQGELQVTASLGVAASSDGDKDALIADTDAALYTAKRQGKNRTVRALPQTANVFGAE